MQEYRRLNCSGCGQELKFPVTEKDFGTTLIVRCRKCGPVNRAYIPVPALKPGISENTGDKREPSLEETLKTLNDLLGRKYE